MVDVNTQNKTINVNVSSSGVSSNVNASGDTTLYYSNKAREWAISNRIVDGVDYSSKYYAGSANQSALNAQSFAQSAQDSYNNFQDSVTDSLNTIDNKIQEANDNIEIQKQNVITEIENLSEQEQNKIIDLGIDTRANIDLSNLSQSGEKHFLNKQQITNCILEVPQRIKLELADGVSTLKAGSEVIVPNGFEADGVTPKFDEVVVEEDVANIDVSWNGECYLIYNTKDKLLGARSVNHVASGSTQPTDGNISIWYDTANNIIKEKISSVWIETNQLCLPPAMVMLQTETPYITSIDQVFNGMGYIGSTVWVDKGVKGLIPNGRNEDGSLRNIEVIFDKVKTATLTFGNQDYYIGLDGYKNIHFLATHITTYLEDENLTLDHTTGIHQPWALVGRFKGDANNTITNFNPKLPFRAIDYSDKSTIASWPMPSGKQIALALGVSGLDYTAPANGYFSLIGKEGTNDYRRLIIQASNLYANQSNNPMPGSYGGVFMQVGKNESVNIQYGGYTSYDFTFVYAKGEV